MSCIIGNGAVAQISVVYSFSVLACGILDSLTRQLVSADGYAVNVGITGLYGIGKDYIYSTMTLIFGGFGIASYVQFKLGFAMDHIGAAK